MVIHRLLKPGIVTIGEQTSQHINYLPSLISTFAKLYNALKKTW